MLGYKTNVCETVKARHNKLSLNVLRVAWLGLVPYRQTQIRDI